MHLQFKCDGLTKKSTVHGAYQLVIYVAISKMCILCAAKFVAKVWRGAFLFLTVLMKCFSMSGVFTEEETVRKD